MFRPLSLFIGLRYTGAKRRNHFISFISLASMLGIALGVTVLITVLSVMNGFDEQIENRIIGMAPHTNITKFGNSFTNWQGMQNDILQVDHVKAVQPYVAGQGMLSSPVGQVHAAVISGILPEGEKRISDLHTKMVEGSLDNLKAKRYGIVIGRKLAMQLGAMLGTRVTLMIPEASVTPVGLVPRFKRFEVVGIFESGGGFGFDSGWGFIHLNDAQTLFKLGNAITGLRLKLDNLYHAPTVANQLIARYGELGFNVQTWMSSYGPLFEAIKLEKSMMFFILLLIVAVAVFNLVSTLVMVVADKRSDIAILRTFGARPHTIMRIFMVQGLVIGVVGTLIGLIGGVALASNVTDIVSALENFFSTRFLSSTMYWVDYLPSKIQLSDILKICGAALIMSWGATLYPAWRASRTIPAEALRYE